MNEITKGTRIINFVIDITIIVVISEIFSAFLDPRFKNIIFYIVYLFYYFIFEFVKSQTIGKIITKTVVVDMNNLKPSFARVLLRTLLRLNPFDGYSYLFGQEQGGHDLISKTRLKKAPNKN